MGTTHPEHRLSVYIELSKQQLQPPIFKQYFQETIQSSYQQHYIMYTDGSKSDLGVGSTAISRRKNIKITLPAVASIFTAELHAITQALRLIHSLNIRRTLIVSDSLSAIKAIGDISSQNQLVQRIQQAIHQITGKGKEITLLWIPGHSGIDGNEEADKETKQASSLNQQFIHTQYTDWYRDIRRSTYDMWNEEWRDTTQQLRHIKPVPGKWCRGKLTRREKIILNRLRSSHTRLTHEYLMQGIWQRRVCGWRDDAHLTVERILVNCNALTPKRARVIEPYVSGYLTIKKLLGETANPEVVFRYLAQLKLLDMI